MKNLQIEVERFYNSMGITPKPEIKLDKEFGEDHRDVLILDHTFILGFYKPDETYFLQTIKSDPGSRDEPPSEDYVDVFASKRLGEVLVALASQLAKVALDSMSDEDHAIAEEAEFKHEEHNAPYYTEETAARSILSNMTANAKTPKGLASELKRQFVEKFGLNAEHTYVWSPEESAKRGYGDAWSLCSEDAPFEWSITLTGWNKAIYEHKDVFSEPYNSYVLSFRKRD